MARNYKRNSKGQFSGGGGSKAATTRATNTARANDLKAKGTTAIGGRVQAKGFAGQKAAQQRAGGLRSNSTISAKARPGTVNSRGGQSAAQASATKGAAKKQQAAASRAAQSGKPPARTDKAPSNPAKARYKELSSRSRKSGPFRSAAENRAAAGARRSMSTMVSKRGRK